MKHANSDSSHSMPGDESSRVVRVGSDPGNDIVADGITVHPAHVEFTILQDGCLIRDLTQEGDKESQTFLAPAENPSERIRVSKPRQATYEDVVYLGTCPFFLAELRKRPPPKKRRKRSRRAIGVGAAPDNRIVVTEVTVSPHHAEFTLETDGCFIQDLGSKMGTFLADSNDTKLRKRIKTEGQKASCKDVVFLGTHEFPLSRLYEIKDFFLNSDGPTRIGRAADNDRVLEDITISGHHAVFSREGDRAFIKDSGGISGVFLNDEKLPPRALRAVGESDVVKIGPYELAIGPDVNSRIRVEYADAVRLDIDNLQYVIKKHGSEKRILHKISFSVLPGELVGILGPSGHGKSLLLECIMGHRIRPTGGEVFINEKPLSKYRDRFRGRMGHVPQGEVLPSGLKVKELLAFAARLWIPSDLSKKEIDERVDAILAQLNLRDAGEYRIGDLSGGEYRRVSLAYELIRSPNPLLLDEPTTGLSVSDAKTVMSIPRRLADEGRTIVAVIHQPSFDVFNQFDLVAILFKGRVLYYGPPQFSYDYFECKNDHPEEIFSALEEYDHEIKKDPGCAGELMEKWEQKFCKSPVYKNYVSKRFTDLGAR